MAGAGQPGRKTKYKPEYCDQLIEHMAQGYSFLSFAGKIRVHRSNVNAWRKEFPEFEDAYQIAKAACFYKWDQWTLEGLFNEGGKSLNSAVYTLNMINRFGWRNKPRDEAPETVVNNTTNNVQSLPESELDAKIAEKLKNLNIEAKPRG